jgi:hypothetical protein
MSKVLLTILVACVLGCSDSPGAPGESGAGGAMRQADARGVYGPYATIRRAVEVRDYYIARGYNAIWYHNGDGYYVTVR